MVAEVLGSQYADHASINLRRFSSAFRSSRGGGSQIPTVLSPRTGGTQSYRKSLEFNTKSPPGLKLIGIQRIRWAVRSISAFWRTEDIALQARHYCSCTATGHWTPFVYCLRF